MIGVALSYLTIGSIVGVLILWITTDKDYDNFIRNTLKEEPPTLFYKLTTAISSIILWPLHLYWMIKHD